MCLDWINFNRFDGRSMVQNLTIELRNLLKFQQK